MTTNNSVLKCSIEINELDNSRAGKPLRIQGTNHATQESNWYSAFDRTADSILAGASVGSTLAIEYVEKAWQSAAGGSGINRTIRRATAAASQPESQPQSQPQSQPPAANSSREYLIIRQVALKEASSIAQVFISGSDPAPKLDQVVRMIAGLTDKLAKIVLEQPLDESIEETIEPPAEPDFLENI